MLGNARLLYILVDGLYYRFSGGQVIVTVNPLAPLYSLTDQGFTLSNRNRTRPYETFIITIVSYFGIHCVFKVAFKVVKTTTKSEIRSRIH